EGGPVEAASVRVLDTAGVTLASAITDARGVARLSFMGPSSRRYVGPYSDLDQQFRERLTAARFLEVRQGPDRALTDLAGRSTVGVYDEELTALFDGRWPHAGSSRRAAVFADRGIYQPGERVHVGAVIREGDLGALRTPPDGDSARVRLDRRAWDGATEVVRDTVVRLSPFGTLTDSMTVRASAATGEYRVQVALARDGEWRTVGSTTLRVAEYRAPEFLVTATIDNVPRVRGDTVAVEAHARYLFGAPMARTEVRWNAVFEELSPWELSVPGLGRAWAIGRQGSWWESDTAAQATYLDGVDTLDANGAVRLRIPSDSTPPGRGARVAISVMATDLNRQAVATSVHTLVHPASFYVALRDSSAAMWWPTTSPKHLQLLAVRPDGRRVTGIAVRVALVAYRWSAPDTGVAERWARAWRADTLRVDTLVTADTAQVLTLPTLREGPVQLVATALDERGRRVITTMARYVYGGAGLMGGDASRLPLRVEVARLAPGSEAIVRFTSPWPDADAWVAVEREGVLSEQVLRDVRGEVTFRVPIEARFIPNAFVSVLLVRRGPIGVADSAASRLRIGQAALRVDDAEKRLAVQVHTGGAIHAPGGSATIDVSVRDARGRGAVAEATIWAVDEGVLALTDFATPDLMRQLYAPVENAVAIASALRQLPSGLPAWSWRVRDGLRMIQGGMALSAAAVVPNGGGGDLSTPRQNFHTTAFFRGGVRTDTSGRARITVRLPENITTFRVMAVAVSAHDEYGSGQSPLLVTKPLILRAALPRFLRPGDSVLAGAVVNARDRRPRNIVVTASGRGVTLVGDSMTRTRLTATGVESRFAWRARAADSARFQLGARDGTNADAVALALPIKPDQSPRALTVTGMIRDTATVVFRLPRNVDAARSTITIRTGTSPLPTLRVAQRFLLAGSLSCPDELTRAGRMLVSLLDLERHGTPVLGDTLWVLGEMQHIADEIARRERGGWQISCWGAVGAGSPVRAAANLLLLDLRDAGVTVDTSLVRRVTESFTRQVNAWPLFPDTVYGRREERAYRVASHLQARLGAVTFLRRTGDRRAHDLTQLRNVASRLTWEDRAWLAELLEQSGDHAGARTLLDRLWRTLGDAGNRVEVPDSVLPSIGFPSHVRPVARLLTATLAIAPDHPRLGALVERLATRQRAERDAWWNAEDHLAAAVALSRFARLQHGRGGTLHVVVGGGASGSGAPAGGTRFSLATEVARDTTVSLAGRARSAGDSVEVQVRLSTSDGISYYAATVDEMLTERPTAPASRGLIVERWYERLDNGTPVTELREGDLVQVRLRVTAPASREFVAVEDALPAGLEPVDGRLRTSGALGPFASRDALASTQRGDTDAGGTAADALYGSWLGGWWSPWSAAETHDDRTVFRARRLWRGSFTLRYLARATTAGRFVRPPAHAEEAFNRGVNGRSEGGWFVVRSATKVRGPK
ncbi:MAG: alpha-2-macroglobulin family protein, partial [Gemmatimonadaceae bacterium]